MHGAVAAWHLANTPEMTDELSVLLFCDGVHVDKGVTLKTYYCAYVSFVDVEPYRLTVWRHHWHCCICNYSHSSGSIPVFLECTSNCSEYNKYLGQA